VRNNETIECKSLEPRESQTTKACSERKTNAKFSFERIGLGTLAYALEKASNLPPFHFVCLRYNFARALRYQLFITLGNEG